MLHLQFSRATLAYSLLLVMLPNRFVVIVTLHICLDDAFNVILLVCTNNYRTKTDQDHKTLLTPHCLLQTLISLDWDCGNSQGSPKEDHDLVLFLTRHHSLKVWALVVSSVVFTTTINSQVSISLSRLTTEQKSD